MKYFRDKAFPYPVLSQNDDFVGCQFQASAYWKLPDAQQVKLCVEFTLSDDNLIQLIKQKKAKFSIEVHCSKTYTRKIITVMGKGKQANPNTYAYADEFLFSASELCGPVTTNCYIISSSNSDAYLSENFNEDYGNAKFHIEEGYVLAVCEPAEHHFDTEPEKPIGTFLRLMPSSDLPLGRFMIDYDDENYINIMLHQQTKASIELMRQQKQQKKILWSAFIFPVILEIMHEMQDGAEDHNDKRWFVGINKVLKKLDPSIDFDEKNKQYDLVTGAQQLMHNPIDQIIPRDDSHD